MDAVKYLVECLKGKAQPPKRLNKDFVWKQLLYFQAQELLVIMTDLTIEGLLDGKHLAELFKIPEMNDFKLFT